MNDIVIYTKYDIETSRLVMNKLYQFIINSDFYRPDDCSYSFKLIDADNPQNGVKIVNKNNLILSTMTLREYHQLKFDNRGKRYLENDKFHREDGPAIIYTSDIKEWYLNGEYIDPYEAINDTELKQKYPELYKSIFDHIIVRSIHNS